MRARGFVALRVSTGSRLCAAIQPGQKNKRMKGGAGSPRARPSFTFAAAAQSLTMRAAGSVTPLVALRVSTSSRLCAAIQPQS